MIDWEKRLRMARIVAGIVLIAVLVVQAIRLPEISIAASSSAAASVDPVLKTLTATMENLRATTATTKAVVETISKDYYDPKNPEDGLYWNVVTMLESSTVASRTTEELIEDLRAALMGGKDTRGASHAGVFPEVTGLLGDLRQVASDADAALNRLADSTDAALEPLAAALRNIERLTDDLDKQVRAGGNADELFRQLARAVGDFDKLLADPNIQQILASSAKTSEHLAGSAESVDIALRPWRQKATQLKMILSKILGMIKFDPTRW